MQISYPNTIAPYLKSAYEDGQDALALGQLIEQEWKKFYVTFDQCEIVREAIIEEYPIGRGDRGKCKLSFDYAAGKGWRSVRTTTNRNGHWCNPKRSVYSNLGMGGGPIAVVIARLSHCWLLNSKKQAAWIHATRSQGPYFTLANWVPAERCEDVIDKIDFMVMSLRVPPPCSMSSTPQLEENQLFDVWWSENKRFLDRVRELSVELGRVV